MIRLGLIALSGSILAVGAYELGARGRPSSEATAGHAEAFRLEQVSHERQRADLARACLERRADEMASTGAPNSEAATAIFEACTPAFTTYAVSLIAMSPSPIYAEAPDLVARWKPYYVQVVLDRMMADRGVPHPLAPADDAHRDISL